MPNSSAMGRNPARSAAPSGTVPSSTVLPSTSTWTRMKKWLEITSANCWLSRMLQPEPCR